MDWISESVISYFRIWIGYEVDEKVSDWIRIAKSPYAYTTATCTEVDLSLYFTEGSAGHNILTLYRGSKQHLHIVILAIGLIL